jgi:hypothetical protein
MVAYLVRLVIEQVRIALDFEGLPILHRTLQVRNKLGEKLGEKIRDREQQIIQGNKCNSFDLENK